MKKGENINTMPWVGVQKLFSPHPPSTTSSPVPTNTELPAPGFTASITDIVEKAFGPCQTWILPSEKAELLERIFTIKGPVAICTGKKWWSIDEWEGDETT
jgi:hypothetical protein